MTERPKPFGPGRRAAPDVLDRAERLYASGLSTVEVATQMDVPPGTVTRWLKRRGVTLRPYTQAGKMRYDKERAIENEGRDV